MFLQSLLVFSLAKPDPLPASIFALAHQALVHNVKMERVGVLKRLSGGGGLATRDWLAFSSLTAVTLHIALCCILYYYYYAYFFCIGSGLLGCVCIYSATCMTFFQQI